MPQTATYTHPQRHIFEKEHHWIGEAQRLSEIFAQNASTYDTESKLPLDNLRLLHETGFDTLLLPEKFGGESIHFQAFGRIVETIARGCPSTACLWVMHVGAATSIITLTPEETGHFFAEELRNGKAFANALSEPASGNQFLQPAQAAIRTETGWKLDGAKRFVSGSERADYFLVNVLVDGEATFFCVPKDETIQLTDIWDALGLRATRSQLVGFNKTVLQGENRCRPLLPTDPNPIGIGLPFMALGIANAALHDLIQYAKSKFIPAQQQRLADLQWVRFDVAQAHVQVQAATLLAQYVCQLADEQAPNVMEASLEAKLLANQVAKDVADLALRVAGGSGFVKPSPIERHLRNAQAPWLMAYSGEVCQDVIGQSLLASDTAEEA